MVETVHIDADELGQQTFPEELRNKDGRYRVRGDGPKFWDWEKEATKHLQSLGYQVGSWRTEDGDDFGPLTRAVQVSKDGKTFHFWYG